MPEARAEEIELGELLNKAVELYRSTPYLNINIIQNPHKIFIVSDRSQLLSVFTNLLENAKQAIPAERHGYIEVSVAIDAGNVIVSISDNGAGIPEDIEKRIFQPYFTTKSSGTGLGLAMTKKIIELWQGRIWFESKQNEGSTFFVQLGVMKVE
jgi:signal transduction histidine kinase